MTSVFPAYVEHAMAHVWVNERGRDLVEMHPAVHLDCLAGHVGISDHHQYGLCHLLRQTQATEGDLRSRVDL